MTMTRRGLVVGSIACLVTFSRSVIADVAVPIDLQVKLLAKVAGYDRNLQARAQGVVRVLIVKKADDADSASAAGHAQHDFGDVDTIGGLPHEEEVITYAGAPALAAYCEKRHASIVYLMPGLSKETSAIRESLSTLSILSATAEPEEVAKGVVVGFDQVSGKPKLLINLPQARRQQVEFAADVLRVATVIR